MAPIYSPAWDGPAPASLEGPPMAKPPSGGKNKGKKGLPDPLWKDAFPSGAKNPRGFFLVECFIEYILMKHPTSVV